MRSLCYVLMLVYADGNWMDIGGNVYPTEGYIEAQEFTRDIDIRYGLCGILWGETCYLPYEKTCSGNWLAVKTELNEDLIKTDSYYNRYKFRNGLVVYSGNLKLTSKYIVKHKDKDDYIEEAKWVVPEDIAGTTKWFTKYK